MNKYINLDNVKFLLFDVFKAQKLCELERYQDYDLENFNLLIQSTKDFGDKILYPTFKELDEQAAYYKDGKIIVHPVVGEVMRFAGANGSIGAYMDYEYGGMQLPSIMHSALSHIIQSANNSLPGYIGLTSGAANLICTFGSQELIDTYVPKMLAGEWAGTMCLTEPNAGSSLSDLTTSAELQEDGSYKIKGQKIFISGGDHEYCENFIHLVLARIVGAPQGTKGISLFVVPKNRINSDGTLESNDVTTAGDFQKLGQKGYCTTHLVYGEKDNCKAWLVGAENKGLKYMFQMMNGARIDVGLTAASTATAAYYASLQYAKERPQGRRITEGGRKNKEAPQTLIINHPDVRRMLLFQRAITEGSISLLLEASLHEDMSKCTSGEVRERHENILEMLTPIAKTYPSEMGRLSISNGLQILGGYGFCKDFPLEQYYRDVRIMALYEGTTGIQSLDLLGRKVVMKNGEAMKHLKEEIVKTITAAKKHESMGNASDDLEKAVSALEATIGELLNFAMSGKHERYLADATIFMEMMGTIIIAWQWLKMANAAELCLQSDEKALNKEFYENKKLTMQYFFTYELPKIYSLKAILMNKDNLTIAEEFPEAFK